MFYGAKNGKLKIGNTDMDYISFGHGKQNLVVIPGLGDGMRTVKGMAVPFAFMYRKFAKDFKVYFFSRKNKLENGCTTRDMAHDEKTAMEMLGIKKAHIVGVSQGGMIAQHFAVDYPEMVEKLVLVVTLARPGECLMEAISGWIDMAKKREYRSIMKDIYVRMYTADYVKKHRWLLPFIGRFGRLKSYERFIAMAEACLSNNVYDKLEQISAPVLVIGGELDVTVGAAPSREIAEKIRGSELVMYPEYGHGLYLEAKDFNERVFAFLMR